MGTNEIKPFNVKWLARTAILLALTLAFQMMGLPQPVTGPAVNAMLLLSGTYVGAFGGIVIGLLTPVIAFARGILPPPLAPMIPFIMLGNAALVILYLFLRNMLGKKYIGCGAAIICGAVVKFLILSGAVRFIVSVPPPVAKAMQIPQLFTAIVGGIVAVLIEKILDNTQIV